MKILAIGDASIIDITVYDAVNGQGVAYAVECTATLDGGSEHTLMSGDFESQTDAEALCDSLLAGRPEAIALAEQTFTDYGVVDRDPDQDEPEYDLDDDCAAERQALDRAYNSSF